MQPVATRKEIWIFLGYVLGAVSASTVWYLAGVVSRAALWQ